jgi:hypothetical protein
LLTCIELLETFAYELAQPIKPERAIIDYVPTQFLCEYIKSLGGFKGIIFNSSFGTGNNYVVFEPSDFVSTSIRHGFVNVRCSLADWIKCSYLQDFYQTKAKNKNLRVRFAEMYHLSPSLPFNPLSHLVRFGRIAEVTIKGAQWPKLAHLRPSANGFNERPSDGRVSFNSMTVGYCHQQTRGNRHEAIMRCLVE